MSKRARRRFTDEFKAEAVELVRSSGKTVGQIARDLALTETALREWVKKASGDPDCRIRHRLNNGYELRLFLITNPYTTHPAERDADPHRGSTSSPGNKKPHR